MLFLENAMGLPMYGVDLHPAKVILFSELNFNSNLENIWKVFIVDHIKKENSGIICSPLCNF